MKKFLAVLVAVLNLASPYLLPSRAGASPYYWSSYSEKDGLIYNTIAALAIDPGGYIWIGTGDASAPEKGGLSVLDRTGQFVSYTTAEGLTSNDIRSIAFEKVPEAQIDAADQGAIWIATRRGVSVLSRRGEWLSAAPGSGALPGDDITAVFIDRANTKWIAVRGSGVCAIDSTNARVNYSAAQGLCSTAILCITQDSSGRIWLGSQDSGVCFREPGGAWVTFSSENSGLIGNCVRQVVEEKPGTLWFVTASGVSVFSGQNWMSYTAKNSPLAGFAPTCMVIDPAGSKWIGTEDGGLFKFDSLSGWTRFTSENSGLAHNRITALALDRQGVLWIGTPSGLCRASAAAELVPVTAPGKQPQRKPLGLGRGRYIPFQDAMVWSAHEQPSSPVSLTFYLPALYAPGKLWFYSALWADANFNVQNSRYQITGTRQGTLSATVQGTFSRAHILIAGAQLLSDQAAAFDKSRAYPFPPQQPDERAVYLQPGVNIPSDDPAIKTLADSIVPPASRTDMYRTARAIVYSHPVQDCALDSARDAAPGADTLQVLKEKKGGRREKARLLCALARAAGIPARIAAGSSGAVWTQLFVEGAGWIPVEVSYPLYDYMRPQRTGMPETNSSADAPVLSIAGIDDDLQRLSWEPLVPASTGSAETGELPPLSGSSLLFLKINTEDRVPDDAKVKIGRDIFVLADEERGETVLLFHDRAGRTIKTVPLPGDGTAATVSIAGRLQWRFIPRRISQILAIENLECRTDEEAKR
jgi:streptogramin lyase